MSLQTPIWCLVLAILLALIFLVPVGIVSAASGTTVGLNVITELLYGLIRPGKPVGNVFFKVRLDIAATSWAQDEVLTLRPSSFDSASGTWHSAKLWI